MRRYPRAIYYEDDLEDVEGLVSACDRLAGTQGISLICRGSVSHSLYLAPCHDPDLLRSVDDSEVMQEPMGYSPGPPAHLAMRLQDRHWAVALFDEAKTNPASVAARIEELDTALGHLRSVVQHSRSAPTRAIYNDGLGEPDPNDPLAPGDLESVLDDMFGDV
jgi:hypothetical protein